ATICGASKSSWPPGGAKPGSVRLAEAGAGASTPSMRAAVPLCVYTPASRGFDFSTFFFLRNCLSPPRRCAARSISFSAHLPVQRTILSSSCGSQVWSPAAIVHRGGGAQGCARVQAVQAAASCESCVVSAQRMRRGGARSELYATALGGSWSYTAGRRPDSSLFGFRWLAATTKQSKKEPQGTLRRSARVYQPFLQAC
ncbi:unnamed protein product, partial [Pelagomonas calceolata]